MCHHCGHSQVLHGACPECGGILNFVGTGTQKVQEELNELFPWAETMRMDTDTVSAAHPHEELLDRFRKEKVPILVGTQMVAKGLDFENVTLVGVVAPDLSLYVDDFRAAERTFSLLTQVIGRAGRGEKQGRAVIQTYTPEHEVIRFGAVQDYDAFYENEIQLRQLRGYPPFSEVIRLTASGKNEAEVLRVCSRIRQGMDRELGRMGEKWKLLGPAPGSIARVNNRYRYHLTLLGPVNRPVRTLVESMLKAAHMDKENHGVSVYADWNPSD
jgi:primosomal protein N' (replication factor Y)